MDFFCIRHSLGIGEHCVFSKYEAMQIFCMINGYFILELILFEKSHKIQGYLFVTYSGSQLPYHKM